MVLLFVTKTCNRQVNFKNILNNLLIIDVSVYDIETVTFKFQLYESIYESLKVN